MRDRQIIARIAIIAGLVIALILVSGIAGQSEIIQPVSGLPTPVRYCENVEPVSWDFSGIDRTARGCANPINSNCEDGLDGSDAVFLDCEIGYNWSANVSQMAAGVAWVPMIYGAIGEDDPCPYLDPDSGPYLLGPNESLASYTEIAITHYRMWECYSDTHPLQISAAYYSFLTTYHLEHIREEHCRLYDEPPHWHALSIHCYGCYKTTIEGCEAELIALAEFGQNAGIDGGIWITESGGPHAGIEEWIEYFWPLAIQSPDIAAYFQFATRYRGDEPWAWGVKYNTSLIECENGIDGPILTDSGQFWMTYEPPSTIWRLMLPMVMREEMP